MPEGEILTSPRLLSRDISNCLLEFERTSDAQTKQIGTSKVNQNWAKLKEKDI